MEVKVSEASGPVLDWMVAKCEGRPEVHDFGSIFPWTTKMAPSDGRGLLFHPSTNWAQGGPIIDREKISVIEGANDEWQAGKRPYKFSYGPTPLIAAMRCYVASKLGNEVEVPDELV